MLKPVKLFQKTVETYMSKLFIITTLQTISQWQVVNLDSDNIPYFPTYKTHRPIWRTLTFTLAILEKNNDEYISILVIFWKKTGLLRTKISNHNVIYSS
jgi:hypothetical protein